jgi:hypothetical protein
MRHGPVLSQLYDLIRGKCGDKNSQNYWDVRFSTDGKELLANFDQFPEGKLSRAEKEILDTIDGQFHQREYGKMIEYVHTHCPEWKDPGDSSTPLKLQDILAAVGRTREEIDWILEENEAFEAEDRIFNTLTART